MLQELILIFTQFGGGPGDPANNVVRFLLAAFFWLVLFLVSYRMWRSTADKRHLFFSISAAVGGSRELFMFAAEYGSFRGYISFPTVFRFYPPLEHSVETLSIILMGYAFLRFYFNFSTFSRLYLIIASSVTALAYMITAPLWLRFLDAADRASLTGAPFIGAQFHGFFGDLLFRVIGIAVTLFILAAFVYARSRSIKAPWLAFLAFSFFLLDHVLQAINDLHHDRFAPVFAAVRHCLHTGGIVLLVGVYWWEITQQLRNGKQFLQTLLDALPDHVFYKNTQGVYLGCNQTFAERFVGRPTDSIIGHSEQDLVSDPVLAERFMRSDQAIMALDKPLTYELPYTLSDGKQVVLETIKTAFHNTDGQVAGLIGVSRDITERKSLEEQLRHSQKMDAIGQLAGGIAHDFNNILTAIIGYASLMQLEITPNDAQWLNLNQILSASERATKLVQNLMAFSRKDTLTTSCHDLNDIVGNFQDFLQQIITEDIQLRLNRCEAVLSVQADSGQIEQALTNLVANARDAMPKGGKLIITTQLTAIDDSFIRTHGFGELGSYALIAVADSGCGMDEETQKRIFEPFFTTKDVGKGTGLGLSIVYGIIKQHRGFVAVSSEPGTGTAFRIYLPIVAPDPPTDKKAALASAPEKGTETILVAEDDPAVRDIVLTTLRNFGYTAISAEDGQDAVEKFTAKQNNISLVVMDIIMPRKNGKDAADEIRTIRPGIKVLFTSGYTADIIRNRGELDAGEELIVKPVHPLELLRKIREMLSTPP